jgi:adenine-specific DNA methylase
MAIEKNFDISFVAEQALREKQIQQNYRPIIAVHKWFARRPGTLFRALVLSEFGDRPVKDLFFETNAFPSKRIADPFMGGGTPLIEANRVGCDVQGFDVNPMATWIVKEEIEYLNLVDYEREAQRLIKTLAAEVDAFYRTDCPLYGDKDVPVKYFIWVKEIDCDSCREAIPLYPRFLLAQNVRHPLNVLVCRDCGALNEVAETQHPGCCVTCGTTLSLQGPAKRGVCACPKCGYPNTYPRPKAGPPRHCLFAIEYYNSARKHIHQGRFFKKPDAKDLERYRLAEQRWQPLSTQFVPDQKIPPGDETGRLHRWGYERYRDMFNARQLLGLELSARLISNVKDQRIRHALSTNLSDLLRYQNMLCRYDSMALKSLDIFSVHGFPVGLIQCESNLLGITKPDRTNVGSGGWTNIVDKYTKAKRYCHEPFEVRKDRRTNSQTSIKIKGEWIGECRNGAKVRNVSIRCASSTGLELPAASLDAVFTDPPYFGNVQYGELMDFCYVWLRRLVGEEAEGFDRESTRASDELTGNETQGRDLEHFADGLSTVYSKMARALKPGAPLVFSYHHNRLEAYQAIGVAVLDAGFTCSASIPCPAEMGGSIHIHGTGSSIIDTIFVCRSTGTMPRRTLFDSPSDLLRIISNDLYQLVSAGVKPTRGDIRCIVFGHLTRMAIWSSRVGWNPGLSPKQKLEQFAQQLSMFGNPSDVIERAWTLSVSAHTQRNLIAGVREKKRAKHAVPV